MFLIILNLLKNKKGEIIKNIDPSNIDLNSYNPIYKKFSGWECNISKIEKFENLPNNTKRYINFIEKYLNVKIYLISVGPERKQNIIKKTFF